MIIEATQTRSPGNVELLILLLNKIEAQKIVTKVYLGHEYTLEALKKYNYLHISLVKSSSIKTLKRFLNRRKDILFFCSYPPIIKNKNALVYFHSSFFTNPYKFLKDKNLSKKTKLSRIFAHYLIKFFNGNVDYFYCQTDAMENELKSSFKGIKVKKVPFYNDTELKNITHIKKDNFKYDFFYPATPDVHKNHFRLFKAIKIVAQKRPIRLCVTIDPKATKYINEIEKVNNYLKYEAIVNVGRIEKNKVLEIFINSKALIFPSFEESLGLPLIEAAFISCPVIGSDLPYIYDVVENPIVFDPLKADDIADKITAFLNGDFDNVIQKNKIENKVVDIIDYFQIEKILN
jgi:glycosyltransferase involved in cell wall biosynthesis